MIWAIVASAILSILCFPTAIYTSNLVPAPVSAIAVWIFLVPLAYRLHNEDPKTSFRKGYVYGLLAYTGIFFWIFIAIRKYGNLSTFVALPILTAMVLTHSLFPAVAFRFSAKMRERAPRWLVGSLSFTLIFWVLNYLPAGGFPWGSPAYGLYGWLTMIQIGDRVGVFGLNFLIFLVNFVLADLLLWVRLQRVNVHFPKAGVALTSLLFIGTLVYGTIEKSRRSTTEPSSPIKVALLQGNIPQDFKWNATEQFSILSTYRDLTLKAAEQSPDLIVWPEAALPMPISRHTEQMPFVQKLTSADIVIGAPVWDQVNLHSTFYNSAFVVTPEGAVKHRYDKIHLVPFGEYVPFSSILPMRYIVPSVAGNFSEGELRNALPRVKDSPYGILICYEVLFPELAVEAVRNGATFLVNITNDAWFDENSAPFQHSHFGIFRAIETRRSIVRAANTGITTWFDPVGRMHEPTKLFERALLVAKIGPSQEMTFYVRYPLLLPILLTLILCAIPFGILGRS